MLQWEVLHGIGECLLLKIKQPLSKHISKG